MFHLLLATHNAHKTCEFAQILGPDFEVSDLSRRPEVPKVEETGHTFEENAIAKAVVVSQVLDGLVVADDSGLEVASLGGAPGVYSARYAGDVATDEENANKLLADLVGKTRDRTARFRCALALARQGQLLAVFQGEVPGFITDLPRGTKGFGYDPVFIPQGYERTFAELGDELKNQISHRALAIKKLREKLPGLG